MTTFQDLGLSDSLLKAIDNMGYTTPTLIQEKAIPFVFMNRDILASAQTGTGKTASFSLPMMDILDGGHTKPRMPRAIILEPTRELAAQVGDNFNAYGKYMKLSYSLVIGGTSMNEQEKAIERGADVLIATPGRLLDLVGRGKVMLNESKMLVIDEADRMMDMGFVPDVEKLVSMMPAMRQTIMFSATFPNAIKKLAEQFLDNPKEIIVAPPASTSDNISQYTIHTSPKEKYSVLRSLLDSKEMQTSIIFCNRKKDVDSLFTQLRKAKYSVGALHGDMDQSKRLEWLEKFRNGTVNMLVCSDVAARGLDIANVSHVFNMDVPLHSEDYVHRIGRTGRAGKLGTSYTFISNNDKKLWQGVLNIIKKEIPEYKIKNSLVTPTKAENFIQTDISSNLTNKKNISEESNNAIDKTKPSGKKLPSKDNTSVQKTTEKPSENNAKPDKKEVKSTDGRPSNRPDNKQHQKKKRFDSQEGIGQISEEETNKPFGQQDALPAFLKT